MNRKARMQESLQQQFNPNILEIIDDSSKHHGHAGARPEGETHYSIIIEAEAFKGMSRVKAHQAIYALLAEEFKTGLHALAIEARAPTGN